MSMSCLGLFFLSPINENGRFKDANMTGVCIKEMFNVNSTSMSKLSICWYNDPLYWYFRLMQEKVCHSVLFMPL